MEIRIIGLIILFCISGSTFLFNSSQLEFYPNLQEKIPMAIGYLFLISLFVERAIEVFLSAWRSEEADKKDLAIIQLYKKLELATDKNSNEAKNLCTTIEENEKNRSVYSAKSRIYAIWAGIIIGGFIALVGIRTLATIVDSSSLTGIHLHLFQMVDILLTATVLAGGSEAINKLMKVYNSFATSTSNKLKEN